MASLGPSVFQNFPVLCLGIGLHSPIVLGTWERSAFSSESGSYGSSPLPRWFLLPRLPASLPLGHLCLDESLSWTAPLTFSSVFSHLHLPFRFAFWEMMAFLLLPLETL